MGKIISLTILTAFAVLIIGLILFLVKSMSHVALPSWIIYLGIGIIVVATIGGWIEMLKD